MASKATPISSHMFSRESSLFCSGSTRILRVGALRTPLAISNFLRRVLTEEPARLEDHHDDQHAEDDGRGPLRAPARDEFFHVAVTQRPDQPDNETAQNGAIEVADASKNRCREGKQTVPETHLEAGAVVVIEREHP